MKITKISIDLAKTSFHICAKSDLNHIVFSKKMTALKLKKFLLDTMPCEVFMEACGSSNFWGRFCQKQGHKVYLIAPQHVKPYVTSGHKNDANDAEAILEAASRPGQYFQQPKSQDCQDLQALLRSREFLVSAKVALTNHLRAAFLECGVQVPLGDRHLKDKILEAIELDDTYSDFGANQILLFKQFYEVLLEYEEKLTTITKKLEAFSNESATAARLKKVPGIGPISAAWFLAFIGDGSQFKNGRQASACLGLVPRQNSTGGKQRYLGITKRGNASVRTALIHGARSYVRAVQLKGARNTHEEWIKKLLDSKGSNKTSVALANKNARILWSMVSMGTEYKVA